LGVDFKSGDVAGGIGREIVSRLYGEVEVLPEDCRLGLLNGPALVHQQTEQLGDT
jgi:hypothetical protein